MVDCEAISHAHRILNNAVIFVRDIFGYMNMKAHTRFSGTGGAAFERRGTEGKGCVEAVAGSDHASCCLLAARGTEGMDEALVLDDTVGGDGTAVAVRDLICQTGADTGLLNRVGDDIKTAFDGVRAGVMIDDAGCAVTDGVGHVHFRAGARVLKG